MLATILIVLFFIVGIVMLSVGRVDGANSPSLRPWSLIPFGLGFLLLLLSTIVVVAPGRVGVPVSFGSVQSTKGSGIHVVAPWVDVKSQDTRLKELTFAGTDEGGENNDGFNAIGAQAEGGGNLTIEMTVQHRLPVSSAGDVYKNIGGDYIDVVIIPSARKCIRDVTPSYTAEAAFTTAREAIAEETLECMIGDVEPEGLEIVDVKIRDVDPGGEVTQRISAKISAEQDLQKRDIELQQAEVDARIRATEAEGIAAADAIIRESISNELLQWRYIEAMKELVDSPNNTVVVMPMDSDLTPLLNIPAGDVVTPPTDG